MKNISVLPLLPLLRKVFFLRDPDHAPDPQPPTDTGNQRLLTIQPTQTRTKLPVN